jgi:formylmethanofuran--tetrahydromethanopterin N-formyltransferase
MTTSNLRSPWDKIEDTYAEAFNGVCCRVIITADDDETLQRAAYDATSTPGTVIGRVEGALRVG